MTQTNAIVGRFLRTTVAGYAAALLLVPCAFAQSHNALTVALGHAFNCKSH